MTTLNLECYSGRTVDESPFVSGLTARLASRLYSTSGRIREHIISKMRADDGDFYIFRQKALRPDLGSDLISPERKVITIKALHQATLLPPPGPVA